VIDDAIALYAPIARHHQKVLQLAPGGRPETRIDGTRTLAVLTALLSIGIHNASEGGTVRLEAMTVVEEPGVAITVFVPGVAPVEGRLHQLEFPLNLEKERLVLLQSLAVCAANARGIPGKLEVVPSDNEAPGVSLRLHCEAVADS
jgi:hypothetical protein